MPYTTALSRVSLLSCISLNTSWDQCFCTMCILKQSMGRSWNLNQLKILPHFFLKGKKISHFKGYLAGFVPQIPGEILFLFSTRTNSGTTALISILLGKSRGKLFIRYLFRLLKSCWVRAEIRSPVLKWTVPMGPFIAAWAPQFPSTGREHISAPVAANTS